MRAFTLLFSLLLLTPSLKSQDYILEDAERFAKIFLQYPDSLSPAVLEAEYIKPGTQGIKIFTRNRIKNADHLANMVNKYRKAYAKGVDQMLPAARTASEESAEVLKVIQELFNQKKSAPVYLVFGGNNSGGTASGRGLVLGLEVLGRFADNDEDAVSLIKSFVAHEVVHVYQTRVKPIPGKSSLLRQSIKEGFADFVENLVLEGISKSEIERHEYGLANEKTIWKEFQEEMHGKKYQPWMYGKGKDGRPSDLGYWIGKRISEAYYNKAVNKEEALMTLLKLKNPQEILEESGYNPN